MKYEYEISRSTEVPGVGTVTVTVSSPAPIDEAEYMILRPDAAAGMAECLAGLANAMRPPELPQV